MQTIVIQDITKPTFTAPSTVTINCEDDPDDIVLTGKIIDALDNCGLKDTTYTDNTSGLIGCNGTGTIIRTWTLTDNCDNQTSHDQTIVVQDITPPSFAAPATVTLNCEDNINDLTLTGKITNSLDNCGIKDTTYLDDMTGLTGCNGTGTIVRTWTVTDVCGNSTNHTQSIVIQDINPPSFDVPSAITIDCEIPTDVSITGNVTNAIDNCGDVQISYIDDLSSLTGCAETGIVTRTWTVIDGCGLSESKTQIITIQDTTKPEVIFPTDITLKCEDDPNNLILTGEPSFNDNCTDNGDVVVTFDDEVKLEGCASSGTIERFWTVSDLCGNAVSKIQIIFVEDVTAPEFTIPENVTIDCYQDYLDLLITGNVDIIPGSCDIGLVSKFSDIVNLNGCNNTGTVSRNWTVSDNCGNSESKLQLITVVDESAPVALCNDLTIFINEESSILITVDQIDGGSYDCYEIVRTIDKSNFFCDDVGTNVVTLTVEDGCQKVTQCQSNVLLVDSGLPSITCQDDVTIELGPNQCEAIASFADAVGSDNCNFTIQRTDNLGLNSGDLFYVGSNVISFTNTDASGNTASCSFEIYVKNFLPSGFACKGQINISLDQNCEFLVTPGFLLTGDEYGCIESYEVSIGTGTPSNFHIIPTSPVITSDYIGQNLIFTISDGQNNISCWGYVLAEDKTGPIIFGSTYEVSCDENIDPFVLGFPFNEEIQVDSIGGFIVAAQGVDNCTDALLAYVDSTEVMNCSSIYSKKIIRKWNARDDFGHIGNTQDTINILRPLLSDLIYPPNYDGKENPYLLCEDRGIKWDTLPNGHPSIKATGSVSGELCDQLFISYEDTRINICSESSNSCFKILREWEVLDWCSSEVVNHLQIIKVLDDKAPVFELPADKTISADAWCNGNLILPNPVIKDNCSNVNEFEIYSTKGTISYNSLLGLYEISKLPLGVNSIYYTAKDCCGNIGIDSLHILVIDNSSPTAICHAHTVVSLGIDSELNTIETSAKVYATSIDDGSHDNCNDVWLKIKRMDEIACDTGQVTNKFNDFAQFCCDESNNIYTVILRVFEVDPGNGFVENSRMEYGGDLYGKFTDCMSIVEIQDKISPVLVAPSDMTISCDAYYDFENLGSFFGDINLEKRMGDSIFINDRICPDDINYDAKNPHKFIQKFIGFSGFAYDACDISITENSTENLGCDSGIIIRTFVAEDASGNKTSATQRIIIENCRPFYISDLDCEDKDPNDGVIWPCNYYGENCSTDVDVSITGVPIIPFETCQSIGIEHKDIYFRSEGEGCIYILREWRIINECQFEVDLDDYHEIEWRYYQEIRISNKIAPTFENCDDLTIGIGSNCVANHDYTIKGSDDCTSESKLQYHYVIDYGNDGILEDTVKSNRIKSQFEIGEHRIIWYVFDGCGNFSSCEQIITVVDKIGPTAYCLHGLSTSIDQKDEVVVFWASDFDHGSYDNCSNPVTASFSQDVTNTKLSISCSDLNNFPTDKVDVTLYLTDSAGNQSKCQTYLRVSVKDEVCDAVIIAGANISGEIFTHSTSEMIGEVSVKLNSEKSSQSLSNMTIQGYFMFEGLKMYEDYVIKPEKNDDLLNGVTTLDLVLIQKHILGFNTLSNPYELIAADINNSKNIAASDLLELRKVILGLKDNFSNNRSWRFVQENYSFPPTKDLYDFPETYLISELSNDQFVKFKGIKIGDVNGSIAMNNLGMANTRESAMPLHLKYQGENVSLQIKDKINATGMQFELKIDRQIDLNQISSDLPNFSLENLSLMVIGGEQRLKFSWNSMVEIDLSELNVLVFKVGANANISLGNDFKNEIYDEYLQIRALELNEDQSFGNTSKLFQNKPNPFAKTTNISFNIDEKGEVSFYLYDIRGKQIWNQSKTYDSGLHNMDLDMELYPSGVYYLKMRSKTYDSVIKMILIE